MNLLVQVVGTLIAVAGLVALLAPDRLRRVFRGVLSGPWLTVASVGRIALGIAFWIVAPSTREPGFVRVLAVLMVAVGLAIPVAGRPRMERFVAWWAGRPSGVVRVVAPLAILFGIAIALAGRPA